MNADAVNTTTSPQLPKYISHAFGSLDQPWKPGYLRSAYGAICCHKFKPKNMTDDIFLAHILGHKLLGPNASLSVPTLSRSCRPRTHPRSGATLELRLFGCKFEDLPSEVCGESLSPPFYFACAPYPG